ncbi:MAG: GNAT family N-acetyltransferase [Solirubrobacteraceae bacterium]
MLLVEELAARAWPAAEAHRLDGWLLRHTPSLTRRRSNSALPLAGDRGDPALVEDFYARRGARALVQVSPAEERGGLDAELERRGWTRDGTTDVLVAGAGAALAGTAPGEVALTDRPNADWVAAWAACEERPDADEHARTVLCRIEPPTAYARAAEGRGVGLAVCERGWAGLFCVATAAGARRRGIAGHVVHALTSWAVERGARRLYLQVESANAPAQAFYERAGFTRSHGYHYRAAPRRGAAV